MDTTGKISQTEVTEYSLFYCTHVTWCSTITHTHIHTHWHPIRYLDTSERVAWIASFFIHALTKFKIRPVSPEFRVEAEWFKSSAPLTWVTLLASRYPFCHTIPAHFFLKLHTCTTIAKRKARGRNFQSEQNGRWLADANLYKKIWVLNKTLTSQGSMFPASKLERVAAWRCCWSVNEFEFRHKGPSTLSRVVS